MNKIHGHRSWILFLSLLKDESCNKTFIFKLYILHDKQGRRAFEPITGSIEPILKITFNVFFMHKTYFFLTFFRSLSDLIH